MAKQYWLVKQEPDAYAWDALVAKDRKLAEIIVKDIVRAVAEGDENASQGEGGAGGGEEEGDEEELVAVLVRMP